MPRVIKKCSFCSKTKEQVDVLVEGPKEAKKPPVFICGECLTIGYKTVSSKSTRIAATTKKKPAPKQTKTTPEDIKAKLDTHIIGQDQAKQILSVAVYNHYKRIASPVMNGVEIDKSNVLLMGPSGCGKTLLVSTIARILDVPFVIADSTSLTEAGYHGNDVEMIFERLYKTAKYDLSKAQSGIVFIDEIDKKCNKSSNMGVKDVSGEGVQMSLLRLIEGDTVKIYSSKRGEDTIDFDTKNVLFIVGGAFVGIEKVIERRIQSGSSVGFGAVLRDIRTEENIDHMLDQVEPDDVHEYGFLREFIGRFPIIIPLHSLSESDLVRIITEPKNCLVSQFQALFKIDGVTLEFDPLFISKMATMSHKRKTGARGLRSVFEKTLSDIQFKLPSLKKQGIKTVVVEKDGNITTRH